MRSAVFKRLAAVLVAGLLGCGRAKEAGGVGPSRSTDVFAGLPPDSARRVAVPICDGAEPSISPGGRSVAFRSWGGDVCVYDFAASKVRLLCRNANAHAIAWNPTGSKIVFQGEDSVNVAMTSWVFMANSDGTGLHKVKGGGPNAVHPVWSPDGRTLVWTQDGQLWEADTAGANGRFLTRPPAQYHLVFARGWMPDGIQLLYLEGTEMGEEFTLRTVGRDSLDDAPHASPMPVVTRSEIGLSADGRLLYRGARSEIQFAEHGPTGRMRRCFVQDSTGVVWTGGVWTMSLASDRSFAVFESSDEESSTLYLVRLGPKAQR